MKPKLISHNSLLGERGVNLIERIVMEMGLIWYPTGSVEAGIDGHIELRDAETGEVFNTVVGVQSKAIGQKFANETENAFDFYCDERDLDYWLRGNLPVVLVVSRPATEEAYWVPVKAYFRDPVRRAARKVRFDKRLDRFNSGCRDALFRLGVSRDAGVYLAPPRTRELLISNLLPVAFTPSRLYVADTHFRSPRELWKQARDLGVGIGGEWILRNKRIISFRDLRRPEWAEICDQGTIEEFATEEWSQTEDRDRKRDFVHLLRRTMREMVRDDLGYHEGQELYFFRPTPDLSPREVAYQGLVNPTDRLVFNGYFAADGSIKYYRHSAFQDRFHRFDDRWYLEITPTYYFTSDGYRTRWRYEHFLKRIKEIEGHAAVRGQVIMWSAFLTPKADMFRVEPYPFLGFENLEAFEVDRGINDRLWSLDKEKAASREEQSTTASLTMKPLFAV